MTHRAALAINGYVLAGGRSSRMGTDKAFISFQGRPLVETAVEKLRRFCATVSIAGNDDALRTYAPTVPDQRREAGPVSGLEAGLRAAERWAMFLPVDVPLAPEELLQRWAEAVLNREGERVKLSFLTVQGRRQPTFCLLHKDCLPSLTRATKAGLGKLGLVYEQIAADLGQGSMWIAAAELFAAHLPPLNGLNLETCFSNLNCPEDVSALEQRVYKLARAQ